MSPKQVAAIRWLTSLLGRNIGGMYNSPGDDPEGRAPSDVEKPVTSVSVVEVDQYVAPSSGSPPDLLDEAFPSFGTFKVQDPGKLRRHLHETVFEPGETHTFAFWAPSR